MKKSIKKFNKKNTKYEIRKVQLFLKDGTSFKIYVLKPKGMYYGRIVEVNPDGTLNVTNKIIDYIYLNKNSNHGVTGFIGYCYRKDIPHFRELAGFAKEEINAIF